MYKGSSKGHAARRSSPRRRFVRTERRDGKRREKKGGNGESPTEPNYRQNPHVYEENYSLYKVTLISLSLISLGAGDSRLAPYMFVFWSLPELIAAQITPAVRRERVPFYERVRPSFSSFGEPTLAITVRRRRANSRGFNEGSGRAEPSRAELSWAELSWGAFRWWQDTTCLCKT